MRRGLVFQKKLCYNKLSYLLKQLKLFRGGEMLKNNIELDVKTKCIEEETTQKQIAQEIGTSLPYVNRVIRSKETIVNRTFVNIMEALGYDVVLTYEKRTE